MYDYEDYYNKPSEFEQQIEEFKQSLVKAVKAEYQEEMQKLRDENESLKEVKKNWNSLEMEYKSKQRELSNKLEESKRNAARLRLDDLFEFCGMNVILYSPRSFPVYNKKCNKCDEGRKIHFTSPGGNDMTEDCECATSFTKYRPEPFYMCEFRINSHKKKDEYPLLMWFKKYRDYDSDYDGYTYSDSSRCNFVYNGEDFNIVLEKCPNNYELFFKDEHDCQKYCDWLSKRNGVTDEMINEKSGTARSHK